METTNKIITVQGLFDIITNLTVNTKVKKIEEFQEAFLKLSKSVKDLANAENKGVSLLDAAIQQTNDNDAEISKFLLDNGAKHDHGNKFSDTPLHYAAYHGRHDIMNRLINAGANINARNKAGRTPLDYAKDGKKLSAIKILVQKGAEVTTEEIKEIEKEFKPKEIEQVFGVTELSQQVIEQVREEATKEQQREVTLASATIEIMPTSQEAETVTYEQKELKAERAIIGQIAEEKVINPTRQYAKLSNVNVVNEAATSATQRINAAMNTAAEAAKRAGKLKKQIIIHPSPASQSDKIESVEFTSMGRELITRFAKKDASIYEQISDAKEVEKRDRSKWQVIVHPTLVQDNNKVAKEETVLPIAIEEAHKKNQIDPSLYEACRLAVEDLGKKFDANLQVEQLELAYEFANMLINKTINEEDVKAQEADPITLNTVAILKDAITAQAKNIEEANKIAAKKAQEEQDRAFAENLQRQNANQQRIVPSQQAVRPNVAKEKVIVTNINPNAFITGFKKHFPMMLALSTALFLIACPKETSIALGSIAACVGVVGSIGSLAVAIGKGIYNEGKSIIRELTGQQQVEQTAGFVANFKSAFPVMSALTAAGILLMLPVEVSIGLGTIAAFVGGGGAIGAGIVGLGESLLSVYTEGRSLLRELTGQQHVTQYEMVIEKPLEVKRQYPEFNNEFAKNTHTQDMRKREAGAYRGME
jgi:hypothetical protein